MVAVLHRTSLGVAGLDAQARFDIGAGALASFAVLQLLVYAGLQVPVGVLLDRFGSLRLVCAGALVMAAGQLLMAFTDGVTGAVVGPGAGRRGRRDDVHQRAAPGAAVVPGPAGAGDHPAHRPDRAAGPDPQRGAAGRPAGRLRLDHRVRRRRPRRASSSAILALVALHDTPERRISSGDAITARQLGRDLKHAWRHPGTRLGLWTHFTTQFTGTVFALMWGFPFLIAGEGAARERRPARCSPSSC